MRISPVDATNLIDEAKDRRHKLAGTALANFGAFIDQRWRQNDMMWGRLDGAERLIYALLPMQDDDTKVVRKELIEQAHRAILREELVPDGREKVVDLICKALDKALAEMPKDGYTEKQIQDLLNRINPDDSHRDEDLEKMLMPFLKEQALMNHVRNTHDVDRNPDPKVMFSDASRALAIIGRMLDEAWLCITFTGAHGYTEKARTVKLPSFLSSRKPERCPNPNGNHFSSRIMDVSRRCPDLF